MNVVGKENTNVLHFKEAAYCGAHMESENFTEEVGAGVPRSAIANATTGVGAAEGTRPASERATEAFAAAAASDAKAISGSLRLPDYGIPFLFK